MAKKFKPALQVREAKFLPYKPPFITRTRSRGRYAVGIRYEKLVQEALELWCLLQPKLELKMGPWLEFTDKSGKRWCQPDVLLVDKAEKVCLVAEVKYQHTPDAWWQLTQLYEPVLAVAMPGFRFKLLEIVHWFDPAVQWPATICFVPAISSDWEGVGTYIYNPKRGGRFTYAT